MADMLFSRVKRVMAGRRQMTEVEVVDALEAEGFYFATADEVRAALRRLLRSGRVELSPVGEYSAGAYRWISE